MTWNMGVKDSWHDDSNDLTVFYVLSFFSLPVIMSLCENNAKGKTFVDYIHLITACFEQAG